MSDQEIPSYRIVTIYGLVIDFAAPNTLEAMWAIFKSEGYFQMTDETGRAIRRIPFHAIGSLEYFDAGKAALAYAKTPTLAKN